MGQFGFVSDEEMNKCIPDALQSVMSVVMGILSNLGSLKIYLSYLDAELTHLDDCKYLYRDDVLGTAFGPIRQSMYMSIVMGFARLCDPAKVCDKDTLSFYQLLQLCRDNIDELQLSADRFTQYGNVADELTKFENRMIKSGRIVNSIKTQRHKLFAHNDLHIDINRLNVKNGLSLDDFKNLYDLLFEFVRYVNGCIINAYISDIKFCDGFGYMFDKLPEAMRLLFDKYGVERN